MIILLSHAEKVEGIHRVKAKSASVILLHKNGVFTAKVDLLFEYFAKNKIGRMQKLKLILIIYSALLTSPCHSQALANFLTTEYTSLTVPQLYHGNLYYLDNATGLISQKPADDVVHRPSLLPSFPSTISAVTILKSEIGGELKVAGNSLSAKNENYVVIYDFTQTQQITISKDDGSTISGLIGVSVRMTAKIHTKRSGINLGNLFGVALAANQEKLTGSLEVKVFGIDSQKIKDLIPVPSDLSVTSVQNSLTSVATIKSHMYDSDTFITPLWLAFNFTGKANTQFDFNKVSNEIQSFK